MTIFEMLQQSFVLTVLGMLVVFVFLWLMVLSMNLSGLFFNAFGSKKESNQQKNVLPPKTGEAGPAITAAITTAVMEHEKRS
jgi:sodium pump decarboxylase gamma subunit